MFRYAEYFEPSIDIIGILFNLKSIIKKGILVRGEENGHDRSKFFRITDYKRV